MSLKINQETEVISSDTGVVKINDTLKIGSGGVLTPAQAGVGTLRVSGTDLQISDGTSWNSVSTGTTNNDWVIAFVLAS